MVRASRLHDSTAVNFVVRASRLHDSTAQLCGAGVSPDDSTDVNFVVRASRLHDSTDVEHVRRDGRTTTSHRFGFLGDPGFDRGELIAKVVLEDGE